jgi:hypothetical protein
MQDPLSGGGASSRASELTDGYDLDGYDDGYVEEANTDFVSGYAGMMSREDGEWALGVVSTVGEWAPSIVSADSFFDPYVYKYLTFSDFL